MSDDDDELSKLEALANSLSDDEDDTDSEQENDPLEDVPERVETKSSQVTDAAEEEITDRRVIDPPTSPISEDVVHKIDEDSDDVADNIVQSKTVSDNAGKSTVVSVDIKGIQPSSFMMSDVDMKDLSFGSLPSISSTDSSVSRANSGANLKNIFDDIGHDNIDHDQNQTEMEMNVVISNEEEKTVNNGAVLFTNYNLDDILQKSADVEIGNDDEDAEDNDEEDDDESIIVSSSDEEVDTTDYNSLSDLCGNYLQHLTDMLNNLQRELERNLSRQREIDLEVSDLNHAHLLKSHAPSKHRILTRKAISVFAAPYFKDKDLYGPPPNEDTKTKRMNKELDVWIEFPKPFSEDERRKLKSYVREDAIRIKSLKLRQEKENIETKLNGFVFEETIKDDLLNQLNALNKELADIQNLPDDKMFVDRFEEYDWEKISVTNFSSAHSPRECQLQWQNNVHPTINRSVFSSDEDKLLKRLAEALKAQDWDTIAREMETGRTGYACFVRYMTRHNVAVCNRKWEKQEDDRLRRLVAHCRINNFIPWTKVNIF